MFGARRRRGRQIRAEAAAWLARIHSDGVRDSDIADFQDWAAADMRHQQAFAAVTSVWDAVGGIDKSENGFGQERASDPRPLFSRRAVVVSAAVAGAVAGVWELARSSPHPETRALETFTTSIGEQRRVALRDGSVAVLDTDSSIAVSLGDGQRLVRQLKGRAHFEVAHDPLHPFVVHAGDVSVLALGTSFDVIASPISIGVVLITGKIQVTPVSTASAAPGQELRSPGEHIVFSGQRLLLRNRVDLSAATAWQDGRAIFDDETLAEAVAEMNRYTRRPIVLSPDISQLRISGTYLMADSEAFATTLSELLPVTAAFEPDQILLTSRSPNDAHN